MEPVMLLILKFSAGLALLFFGMKFMRDGLENAAQNKMKKLLQTLTRTPLAGFITGTVITALVQSSTAVTVITIGLVNAGILSFYQTVGIVLGTNVGTCITAQLISFKLENYVLPIIGLGALLMVWPKGKTARYVGQSLAGFGIIFMGIGVMSEALEPLKHSPAFVSLLYKLSTNALFGVMAGVVFTALIHSSATTTGIVIALSHQGLIDLTTAIAIILGSNIGTCITAVLASIGTPAAAKQVAAAHVMLNIVGVLLILPFIYPFSELISHTASSLPRQIANAHTVFNVASSLVILPFTHQFSGLVQKIVPN
jgi:phosphate:Na+ symporter